ncbi:arylphorin subunit alpha-like [Colias croceus]|uniref:arylphorin subunit alpha-like n=1 Tax=Colias crocea TaxID=72248 RepID=UPI001E27B267|nr:arylphorin subunit alpha-like [Colias croceus]
MEAEKKDVKSVNFVGNFWQGNADFVAKIGPWKYSYSYEGIARYVLSAAPQSFEKYNFLPSALDFYQTSLRDPVFYQLYSKILKYFIEFKKYLAPYTQEVLHYAGVKINDVKVDKLVTYFDYYDFDVNNAVCLSQEELKSSNFPFYVVRQPRLNHKPFSVSVDVKSDAEGEAVFKIFLGPKYSSQGYPISLEDNWMNFVELDWFVQKLSKGQNKIERKSSDFYYVRQDSAPVREVLKMLGEGKVPVDMSVKPGAFPERLVLPKGNKGGYPFQIFVVAYPYQQSAKQVESIKVFANDNKPLGYPLDRPVNEVYFKQPNMFFEDVHVYHEGELYAQLPFGLATMKTVLVLASLVALALAGSIVVPQKSSVDYKVKKVDNDFVVRQQQLLKLLYHSSQLNPEAEYYKIGKDYDIGAHIGDYTNQKAVQEFLNLWKVGFLPKNIPFSIFNEKSKQEAVALFHVFYYAKDFDVFYKTAAFARVYLNEGQFLYAYYIAVLHRPDTKGVVLPAPYEAYPELFTNVDVWNKINRVRMEKGINPVEFGSEYDVVQENDKYVFYVRYSNYFSYTNEEHKISYFTEDIGLNAYYYYFHAFFPFWLESDVQPALKDHRGEIYYYFYQQLLARYYLERLSNGIGEIPEFAWDKQIVSGYRPMMKYYNNFVQRPKYYQIPYESQVKELQVLKAYEQSFIQYVQEGQFNYNMEAEKKDVKSVNFIGNFWQGNADFAAKIGPWKYPYSYEGIARYILGAAPQSFEKYNFLPSALDFYQSSLRDPVFYQLYSKILKYFIEFKKSLAPYTQEVLHYAGVKINDVKVDKLVTYFDYYDFDVNNAVCLSQEELKSSNFPFFVVRQPRLNHKSFSVSIDVKSDVEGEAVFKIFFGPKYNSQGYPISLENNWMNFVELDWFVQKLSKGQNKIERKSSDFYYVRQDSAPVREVLKMLGEGKVPVDMSVKPGAFPERLVLPKGNKGGYPFQIFVVAYPYQQSAKQVESIKVFANDNKPLGYPLDRPVNEVYFKQPNMFFEDVRVYHEGELYPCNTVPLIEVKKH